MPVDFIYGYGSLLPANPIGGENKDAKWSMAFGNSPQHS